MTQIMAIFHKLTLLGTRSASRGLSIIFLVLRGMRACSRCTTRLHEVDAQNAGNPAEDGAHPEQIQGQKRSASKEAMQREMMKLYQGQRREPDIVLADADSGPYIHAVLHAVAISPAANVPRWALDATV